MFKITESYDTRIASRIQSSTNVAGFLCDSQSRKKYKILIGTNIKDYQTILGNLKPNTSFTDKRCEIGPSSARETKPSRLGMVQ